MARKGILIIILLALPCLGLAQEKESLSIRTYYPAPYGSYREVKSQRAAIGSTYINSSIPIPSGVDLMVEGRVRIGDSSHFYTLPNARGMQNQVLIQTDNSGTIEWRNIALRSVVRAYPVSLWKGKIVNPQTCAYNMPGSPGCEPFPIDAFLPTENWKLSDVYFLWLAIHNTQLSEPYQQGASGWLGLSLSNSQAEISSDRKKFTIKFLKSNGSDYCINFPSNCTGNDSDITEAKIFVALTYN